MYHDDSCARLDACINSRLGRGRKGAGGTTPRCTCTRSGVWRPAEEKLASPQPASGRLHGEGMGRRENFWSGRRRGRGNFGGVLCLYCPLLLLFSLLCHLGQAVKSGAFWAWTAGSRARVHARMDTVRQLGHRLASGVGHCLLKCGGKSHP